ncbi:peptide/nickel transport system permease protein [Rhizobiales bacterium GAS191]|nr:peptide/nickel transport system permease protein [Rhizobiales bacterium GAS191]
MQLDADSSSSSPSPAAKEFVDTVSPRVSRRRAVLRALSHRSLMAGLIICTALTLLVIAAPLLTSIDPNAQDPAITFAPPSPEHLMGADAFGRDLFSRVLYGGRTTMLASLFVVAIGAIIGTAIGLVGGYFGGAVGFGIVRLVDLLLAFPGILLALTVTAILGPGFSNGVIAIAVILVPVYARLVEGATVEVRNLPFVDAAITLGAGPWRIIVRHILPNVLSGIIVLTTTWLGIAALWITALGFIGLGVQPPTPEWGAILNDGQNYITLAWWITVFPGVFLSLFVIGVNLIGDGLRDELDPTLARR